MLKIFNTQILNNRQRFWRAVVFSILAGIVSIAAYSFISGLLNIYSSLLFVGAGYFIGWVVLETGHGVQTKFSILAGVVTIVVIILCDILSVYPLSVLLNPAMLLNGLIFVMQSYLSVSVNALIGLLFRISAVVVAVNSSRIV